MEKSVVCKECSKVFEVVGNRENLKEDAQSVTCPYDGCGQINELAWPIDMPFFVRKIPSEM
jgi:hypothetical protein